MKLRGMTLATMAVLAMAGSSSAAAPTPPARPACVIGEWSVVAPDPNDAENARMPVRHETQHFAFRWLGNLVPMADALKAGDHLEFVWDQFVNKLAFPEPHCADKTKLKVNVFVGADYGLSGGADEQGHLAVYIGPGAMRDRFGLAHEFTHALQFSTESFRGSLLAGWLFESHANWMTHQLPEFRSFTHCSVLSVDHPHIYFGSTRVRYCNWQFLEYIKNRFGHQVINDIWAKAPRSNDASAEQVDPIAVLMKNQGWDLDQMNDLFGDWALRNANWDYINPDGTDQGAVYRRSYGGYDYSPEHPLRTTMLQPLELSMRRFAVPFAWAPQRWGYNIVRLHADANSDRVTVQFQGVVQTEPAVKSLTGLANEPATIPSPASNWRWGLVAVGGDGVSRYSPLMRGPDGTATLAVRPDDKALFMVVLGAPDNFQSVAWDQPYHSLYRYPWMAAFTGAMPDGYQPGAPAPTANGHRHANGGGWVADGAEVAASAYVGPHARVLSGKVLGNARIEDFAQVMGGVVRDDARIGAMTIIRADTLVKDRAQIDTTFMGIGEFERGIVLSGDAKLYGDVEQRGISLSRGAFTSIVDQEAATLPERGAALSKVPTEITAPVTYRWR